MIAREVLADAVRLVEKVVAVAQRLLGALVNRNSDRLDVLEAMAFTRGPLAQFYDRKYTKPAGFCSQWEALGR